MIQLIDKILSFLKKIFWVNAFKQKYKTVNFNKLEKIIKSKKWQVLDIRLAHDYEEHHLINSTNIPKNNFSFKNYKKINKNKKILLINSNYRSNLEIYKNLKRKDINVHILYANYEEIRLNPKLDLLSKVIIF